MKLSSENTLKIQRFFQQYKNKSLWQIETQVEKLINELVKDEIKLTRQNVNRKITDLMFDIGSND